MSNPLNLTVRVEDGTAFATRRASISLPLWLWTRLETGEDVLLGPQGLSVQQVRIVRLAPGDISPLSIGTVT